MSFWKRKSKTVRKIEKHLGIKLDKLGKNIPISASSKNACYEMFSKHGMNDKTSLNISSSDLMFLYSLYNTPADTSFKAYINTGWNARNILNQVVQAKYNNWSEINNFLDFASGYGRLTRHLVHELDLNKIWVSDIKNDAIKWQAEEFGVNTIASEPNPEDFKPSQSFDLIFVGSLFTHLPKDLFEAWLKRLWEILSENGTLIISTFDIGVYNESSNLEFEYYNMSEDKLLNHVESSIKEENTYGITYTTPKYMDDIFVEIGIKLNNVHRYPMGFGKSQDLYIIHKNYCEHTSNLDYSQFP